MRMFRIGLHGSVQRIASLLVIVMALLALSGCMYPKDQLKQNQAPPKEAVRNVQAAIDQYQTDTGMLPIKNSSVETPLYEKFIIDFIPLQGKGYLSDLPSASFEKGGNYYFLIINEETKPAVKLMNLVNYQQINDIQGWVQSYSLNHDGQLPKGDQAYPGYYYMDYEVLKQKTPTIKSDFSGQTLAAIMDEQGKVYTDYGLELMQAVQKSGSFEYEESFDLRTLLVDSDMFVPIKSPVYHWVDNQPQAIIP